MDTGARSRTVYWQESGDTSHDTEVTVSYIVMVIVVEHTTICIMVLCCYIGVEELKWLKTDHSLQHSLIVHKMNYCLPLALVFYY